MTKEKLADYCLAKEGAYLDFPFSGEDYAAIKVKKSDGDKSRIFAEIFTLKGEDTLTFSTDAETAAFLRESYPQIIVKGWHCPPVQAKYKSSVALSALDDGRLLKLVDLSYQRALEKL